MVDWNQDEIERRIRLGANRGVLIGAQAVLTRGTERLKNPPKTGHTYRRRGVTHQASAPGESPATDTGRLAGSGDVYPNLEAMSARVNWSTDYARTLELGGRTYGSVLAQHAVRTFLSGRLPSNNPLLKLELGTHTIAARPFARPALSESIEAIKTAVSEQIAKALNPSKSPRRKALKP